MRSARHIGAGLRSARLWPSFVLAKLLAACWSDSGHDAREPDRDGAGATGSHDGGLDVGGKRDGSPIVEHAVGYGDLVITVCVSHAGSAATEDAGLRDDGGTELGCEPPLAD